MKTYSVFVAYTGYVSSQVEAENEDEAIEKAARMGTVGISDFERWPEADMVEEEPSDPCQECTLKYCQSDCDGHPSGK
jgi:hypothetical protein